MSNQFLGKNFKYNTRYTMTQQVRYAPMFNRPKMPSVIINDNRTIFNGGGGFNFGFSPMNWNMPFWNPQPLRGMNSTVAAILGVTDGLSGLLNSTAFMPGGLLNPASTTTSTDATGKTQDEKDKAEIAELEGLLKGKITEKTLRKIDGAFYCQDKDSHIIGPKTKAELIAHFQTTPAEEPQGPPVQNPPQQGNPSIDANPTQPTVDNSEAEAKKKAEEDEAKLNDTGTSKVTLDEINTLKEKGIKFIRDAVRGAASDISGDSDPTDDIGEASSETNAKGYPKDVTVNGHVYSFKGFAPNGDAIYKSTVETKGGYQFAGDEYRLRAAGDGDNKQLVLIQVADGTENGAGTADRTKKVSGQ